MSKVTDMATGQGSRCFCVSEDLREQLVTAMDGGDAAAQDDAKRVLIELTPCCESPSQSMIAPAE